MIPKRIFKKGRIPKKVLKILKVHCAKYYRLGDRLYDILELSEKYPNKEQYMVLNRTQEEDLIYFKHDVFVADIKNEYMDRKKIERNGFRSIMKNKKEVRRSLKNHLKQTDYLVDKWMDDINLGVHV